MANNEDIIDLMNKNTRLRKELEDANKLRQELREELRLADGCERPDLGPVARVALLRIRAEAAEAKVKAVLKHCWGDDLTLPVDALVGNMKQRLADERRGRPIDWTTPIRGETGKGGNVECPGCGRLYRWSKSDPGVCPKCRHR
jgi:hypothetical protein